MPYSNIIKWIVPHSFSIKLKCALFQCQGIESCLIPMSHFEEETSTDQLFLLHSGKSVFDLPMFVSDLPMFVSDLPKKSSVDQKRTWVDQKTNMGRSKTNMGRSKTNIGRSKTNIGRSETKQEFYSAILFILLYIR